MAVTSDEIKRSIIHKILIGQYPVGSTLPSCRDLAADLGINRNTASKIYQELSREGLVKAVRGRGVVVVSRQRSATAPVPGVREHLLTAAREARLLGIDRDAFLKAATDVADELYRRQRPGIAFIECNEQDAESLAAEIEAELSYPVQPVLLSALEESGETIIANYDLVCTTLYHLLPVTQVMGHHADKLVPVHAPPDAHALVEIARRGPGTRVGIVCLEPTTREYLVSSVAMVHRGEIKACLLSERQALQELEHQVDILVDVPVVHKEVSRLFSHIPIVTVGFRIDHKSLVPLRERLAKILSEDMVSVL